MPMNVNTDYFIKRKKILFFKSQLNLNREASCNLSTLPQKSQDHQNTRRVYELRQPKRAKGSELNIQWDLGTKG